MMFQPLSRNADGDRRHSSVVITFVVLLLLLSQSVTFIHNANGHRANAIEVAQLRSVLIASAFDEAVRVGGDPAPVDVQGLAGISVDRGLLALGIYDVAGRWVSGDKPVSVVTEPPVNMRVLATDLTIIIAVPEGENIIVAEWDTRELLAQPWLIEQYVIIFLSGLLLFGVGRGIWRQRAVRDTKHLRERMTRFLKTGEHEPQMAVDHMSPDLGRLYTAFDEMAASSVADVQKAKQSTAEKAVLVREVHHRVKNNLQMMSSILSMHIRDTQNPELIAVLRRIQGRVISLATVHTDLYQSSIAGAVPVAPLLNEIVDRAEEVAVSMRQSVKVVRAFADASLLPDQVVPLSLLTAEVMNVALNDVVPEGQSPDRILLTFHAEPEFDLSVQIEGSVLNAPKQTSIGTQLMRAYATQLGADYSELVGENSLRFQFRFKPIV